VTGIHLEVDLHGTAETIFAVIVDLCGESRTLLALKSVLEVPH
jgi:hypothetical protein